MPCEVRLTRDPATSGWGFRLTGGVTFNMPLTVFEVEEGGEANKRGIRVGDILIEINGMATNKLNLKEANAIVDSNDSMDLLVTNVLDEEAKELEELANKEEQEFLSTRVDVSELDLQAPRPAPRPEIAQRKCWHPIVLDTNPPPIIEETTGDEEMPHKKILRNFRQAMTHKNLDPSPEKIASEQEESVEEIYEEPTDIAQELSMEEQLRIMQRQLAALCTLPATLHKSLAAVTEKINKLLPPDPEPELEPESEQEIDPDEYYQETTEEDYTHDDLSMKETTEDDLDTSEKVDTEESIQVEEEEEEIEPEPVLTPEDIERLEKLRKMEQLNRAWPWGDEIKPVYKISDRYKVSNSKMFNNKIQDIESKMVLRKASNLMD